MTREEILPIAKPMLYNTEMTIAIVNYRKKATRRIAKGIIPFDDHCEYFNVFKRGEWSGPLTKEQVIEEYAPCKVGDYLYVRETWSFWPCWDCDAYCNGCRTFYNNLNGCFVYRTQKCKTPYGEKWHPSIHMPKEAARIFLRVTDVRVERLQDMTLEDFLSEGVVLRPEAFNDPENAYQQAKRIFIGIWDSTTNELKYKWENNPWVWVIGFEKVEVQ